jgi:hypothetical protein
LIRPTSRSHDVPCRRAQSVHGRRRQRQVRRTILIGKRAA